MGAYIMELRIIQTEDHEAEILLAIQKEAFYEDLLKYEDVETSPVNEPIERLQWKINHYNHYTIWYGQQIIGGIDIRKLEDEHYRLNRFFLANDYQNKGLGTQTLNLIEKEFPNARTWSLDTPHLNVRNQHFYEKEGFKKVGEHCISDKLILVDYVKEM